MSNNNELQVELSPEIAEGIYSNLAIISHSSSEFVLDFIRVMPGMPSAPVKSRLILSPEHAKKLMFAMEENIMKYESQFGNIKVDGPQNIATPFMVPSGEA